MKSPGWKFRCYGKGAKSHGQMDLYLKDKAGESVSPPPISSGAVSAAKSLLERVQRLSGKETPKNG